MNLPHSPEPPQDAYAQVQDTLSANLSEEDFSNIYGWYAKAMERGKRQALREGSFIGHFFDGRSTEPTYLWGSRETGFFLGIVRHGIFIPTHNAAKNSMAAIGMMKKLGKGEIPVLIAVTKDISDLAGQIPGWKVYSHSFPGTFRGTTVEKFIIYNSHPQTKLLEEKGLGILAEDREHDNEEETGENIPLSEFEASPEEIRAYIETQGKGEQSLRDILKEAGIGEEE